MICADVGTGSNSLDFTCQFWSIVQDAEFLVRPVPSERKTSLPEDVSITRAKPAIWHQCLHCLLWQFWDKHVWKFQLLDKLSQLFHHFSICTVPFTSVQLQIWCCKYFPLSSELNTVHSFCTLFQQNIILLTSGFRYLLNEKYQNNVAASSNSQLMRFNTHTTQSTYTS
jgi:hypothetical protein